MFENAKAAFLQALRAKGVSPRTAVNYREAMDQLIGFLVSLDPALALEDIRPAHIRGFLAELRERGRCDNTVQCRFRALRTWFYFLEREGMVPSNPIKGVQAPIVHVHAVVPYTEDEVRRMMAAARHWPALALRDQMAIALLYNTGMRAGELCTLLVENVREGTVLVCGKGKRERWLGLEPVTARLLTTYRVGRDGRYVFGLSVTGLHQMIKRLAWRANVPHAHAHRFRDSYAVAFLENGGDLETLQTSLGHASIETTLRYVMYGRERRATEAQRKFAPFAQAG
ncbi:hypothetical protein LCGC14_1640550 [marine sediment metagenome]|uniref:Tyr recombinase domain-containing protein n=1 Tax=marine sediment metagenome TaxID=412755 RepID=A0A0F9HZP3_9ZZZZ